MLTSKAGMGIDSASSVPNSSNGVWVAEAPTPSPIARRSLSHKATGTLEDDFLPSIYVKYNEDGTETEELVIGGRYYMENTELASNLIAKVSSFLTKPSVRNTLTGLSLDVRLVERHLDGLACALGQSRIRRLRLVVCIQNEFYPQDFGLNSVRRIVAHIPLLEELVLDQFETWEHVPSLEDAFEDWIELINCCSKLRVLTLPAIFIDRSIGSIEPLREDDYTSLDREGVISVLYYWSQEILEGIDQRQFQEFRFLFRREQLGGIAVLRVSQQDATTYEIVDQ